MRWLALITAVAGCTYWWDPRPHPHGDPITFDSGLPFVHCGQIVRTGDACEYGVDGICEYTAEGYDAGTPLPIIRCRCGTTGNWYCVEQPYPTCAAAVQTGTACMAGAATCEYEIEADAGPAGSYTCTCADGTWSCLPP